MYATKDHKGFESFFSRTMSSTASQDVVCHLLRLPKEIRLNIYRHLLLPTPNNMLSLAPAICPNFEEPTWEDMDEDDEWGDDDDEDNTDSDNSEDSEGLFSGREYIMAEEANPFSAAESEPHKRHPAILRSNKQIYSEASSLLYTEGVIVIGPGDVFSLKGGGVLTFGAKSRPAWRYDPIKGVGKEENGGVKYDSAPLEGLMFPHVFARFEKVFFDANFDHNHTNFIGFWMDDDTLEIREDDAKEFKKVIRRSSVMKDFVKILGNSPRIRSLEVVFDIEVGCHSNLMDEGMDMDIDYEEEEELDDRIERIQVAANEKATGLFLESGILTELLRLSNVQKFDWKFGFGYWERGHEYKADVKRKKMLRALKQKIEENFTE